MKKIDREHNEVIEERIQMEIIVDYYDEYEQEAG